jgi:hypothetical protein
VQIVAQQYATLAFALDSRSDRLKSVSGAFEVDELKIPIATLRLVPLRLFFSKEGPMQVRHPTPSCARFQSVAIPCSHCDGEVRLSLVEPHRSNLEALTYTCSRCDRDEMFLISSK